MDNEEKVTIQTPFGITPHDAEVLAAGWSVVKQVIGQPVMDNQGLEIGILDDVIVGKSDNLIFAIIGIGGFFGVGAHSVAVEFSRLEPKKNYLKLPDATKEALEALPLFVYPKVE